ncbi:MAG: TetR/AcrR family transcriptional regulator [Clostridia bacterium]|nr:TetR/AcrR family transcriptional regulator [Clostridia bacterium]
MARNVKRDEIEAERRKSQLIEAGFRLFSSKGIESVSMQSVADLAEVGSATMYNYFKTKVNLVVAISGSVWRSVWDETLMSCGMDELMKMNAYQLVVRYADMIINLYRNRPDILRFSSNFKTFVVREGTQKNQLEDHLSPLEPIEKLFHIKYEEARENHCINTEIPEQEMFTAVTLTMLGMAERYADGIVWADNQKSDHLKELEYTRDMILLWIKGGNR